MSLRHPCTRNFCSQTGVPPPAPDTHPSPTRLRLRARRSSRPRSPITNRRAHPPTALAHRTARTGLLSSAGSAATAAAFTLSTAANNPAANHLLHCFIRSLLSVESLCLLFSIITEKSNVVNYILQYFVKQKLPQPQRVGEFAEILFVIFQQRRRAFMSRIWVPRGRRSDFPPNRYVNWARAQPAVNWARHHASQKGSETVWVRMKPLLR